MAEQRLVERVETGIPGLDRVLGGGAPARRCLLISGESGTGKTVLLNAFLYHGINDFDEAGVFVSCEENPDDLRRNVAGFGWDYPALEAARQLAIVDVSPGPDEMLTMELNDGRTRTPNFFSGRNRVAVGDFEPGPIPG